MAKRISDLGELRLLSEVVLQHVSTSLGDLGDDCARLDELGGTLLWSIDPCPTPVAHWLGVSSPEVFGWYTATINLSDIAACGGTPIAMLVSLEMPADTEVQFVQQYYHGLCTALTRYETQLLGGNVKASSRFVATGTILGREGRRRLTRRIPSEDCDFFLVGQTGLFWAAVAAHFYGRFESLPVREASELNRSLLHPEPHIAAGGIIAKLPFSVACMDCSDGPANALHQLTSLNALDLIFPDVVEWSIPDYARAILATLDIPIENACLNFGDWQLACAVPHTFAEEFFSRLRVSVPVTWLGRARRGSGVVATTRGARLSAHSLNENFRGGYNSVSSAAELIERYLKLPMLI